MNTPSMTRYTVDIENHPRTRFNTIELAIAHGAKHVYLGPESHTVMASLLSKGCIAEWSYGFGGVTIYPPQNTIDTIDHLRTINSELVDILARLVSRMHAMNDDRDPLYRAIVYDADKAITRARGTA